MDIVVAYQGRELEGSDKFKIRPRPRIQVKKFMRTVVSNLQDTTAFTSARIRPVQEKLEVSKVGNWLWYWLRLWLWRPSFESSS